MTTTPDDTAKLYRGFIYDPIITAVLASAIDADTASATYNPEGRIDLTGKRLRATIKLLPNPDYDVLAVIDTTTGGISILPQTALPLTPGVSSTRGQAQLLFADDVTLLLPRRRLYVDVAMLDNGSWRPLVTPWPVLVRDSTTETGGL